MIRVGVDEHLAKELLAGFPHEAEIVRIPRTLSTSVPVDFWIMPFKRQDAEAVSPHLRGLKVAQSMMAGVDWILPWLPKDVILCDGRGIHDISTSEWVLTAILSAMKRFPLYRDMASKKEWTMEPVDADVFLARDAAGTGQYRVLGEDLHGKTVLIVGYGSIGAAIEARLLPFGAEVLRLARSARAEPNVFGMAELHALLPQADVIAIVVPLTGQTKGMFGAAEFGLMKRGALIVNAARGPVIVTGALLAALQQEKICAVLDVTDPEPLPAGHPLWSAPNCMMTPHIGGATPGFIHRAFRFGAMQVQRFLAGEPLENVVTDAGY